MEEKICSCALNRIFGFYPKIGLALVSCTGSAAEVFQMKTEEIDKLLGPYSRFRGCVNPQALDEAEKELYLLEKSDIRFTGWTEEDYPVSLHECPDAPIGIYVRTKTPLGELWGAGRNVAVVGTRDISQYGREWCIRTVNSLAETEEKPAIVSGLALGVDFYAHRTAMECGLPTIAVMATGPEAVYPSRHREFAEKLYHCPGCALITDYPPGTSPLSVHFLRRNRIIAGLSRATILIESKIKGGGMMTANLAFGYDRDVYALPGRADDIRSQGCNYLIKNKIAEPLISVDDLVSSLGMCRTGKNAMVSTEEMLNHTYGKAMTSEQIGCFKEILEAIKAERGITLDEIAESTGIAYSKVANIANILETDGFIDISLLQQCSINIRK